MASLRIEWRDNPKKKTGGTMLTIEINGRMRLDKHFPRSRLKEARKEAIRAVDDAEGRFENK